MLKKLFILFLFNSFSAESLRFNGSMVLEK